MAALAFEKSMLRELEKSNGRMAQIGTGNLISKWHFVAFVIVIFQKMPVCIGGEMRVEAKFHVPQSWLKAESIGALGRSETGCGWNSPKGPFGED